MLEFLKDVETIDGEIVKIIPDYWEGDLEKYNIFISYKDVNIISFRLQKGPVKEVGKNGCQVTALIEAAKLIIEKANKENPCMENRLTGTALEEALFWLLADRKAKGVEGTPPHQP